MVTFNAGDRVAWAGPSTNPQHPPTGTVFAGGPWPDGRIIVNWDRTGTRAEDPSLLRLIERQR